MDFITNFTQAFNVAVQEHLDHPDQIALLQAMQSLHLEKLIQGK